jgi:hypothetical protein
MWLQQPHAAGPRSAAAHACRQAQRMRTRRSMPVLKGSPCRADARAVSSSSLLAPSSSSSSALLPETLSVTADTCRGGPCLALAAPRCCCGVPAASSCCALWPWPWRGLCCDTRTERRWELCADLDPAWQGTVLRGSSYAGMLDNAFHPPLSAVWPWPGVRRWHRG